jgi:hypothetical protein
MNLVKEVFNQQKMARYIDFRAPAGRESLWTTDKIVEFSHAYCEVQKLPNLEISIRVLQSIP